MGEASARRVDPRFDPRFQRGYVPDPHAAAPPDAAADDPADRPGFTSFVAPLGDSGDAPVDSGTTRGAEHGSPKRAPDDPPVGERVEEPELAPEPIDEPEHPTEPIDEPDDAGFGERWFWIAIGACLASIALGSILYWLQASDPWMYTGSARSRDEETLSTFLNSLSPALVQAGVVGAVAVLVTWAALGTRRARGRS